jgi:tetratricopeptide (TPR) repeat protein
VETQFARHGIAVLSKADFLNVMMNRPMQAPLFAINMSAKEVENSFAIVVRAEIIIGVVPAGQSVGPVQGTIWTSDGHYVVKKAVFSDLLDYLQRHLDAFFAAYREAHIGPREHVEKGDWAQMAGKPIEALEAYDRALEMDADCWEAMANKAMALRGLGHFDDALSLLNRALEIRPDNIVVTMKRQALLQRMAEGGDPADEV